MSSDAADAYERHAAGFLAARDHSSVGSKVVARWAQTLPAGASTIELGCGGGLPISKTLIDAGLNLHAVDSSPSLCAIFQTRFPDVPLQCARVEQSDCFGRQFHAVVAIGLIFLLPESDQQRLIRKVATLVEAGGRFLFTAPLEKGEWSDANTSITCRSPGQDHYVSALRAAGFCEISCFEDAGANNYYDAVRAS